MSDLQQQYSENLLSDLLCDVKRGKSRLDNKMPIRQTVRPLTFFEQRPSGFLIAGERPLFAGKLEVVPAVIKARLEPNACKPMLADQLAISRDRPCAAAERQDTAVLIFEHAFEHLAFDEAKGFRAVSVDHFADLAARAFFDQRIEIDAAAAGDVLEVPSNARFADAHKTGQSYANVFTHRERQ